MEKQKVVYPHNGLLVIKRNEVLIYATTWMSLENSVLTLKSKHKRPHIGLFHLYEISRIHKSIETKPRLAFTREWAEG